MVAAPYKFKDKITALHKIQSAHQWDKIQGAIGLEVPTGQTKFKMRSDSGHTTLKSKQNRSRRAQLENYNQTCSKQVK